ncbi:prepronociceptin b [Engraulis encrasicolus]|uniref:prepronociceptin b n=1 Tax=Engraulis encrasicolus TaxID=184585 RepID=UPI002FD54AB0
MKALFYSLLLLLSLTASVRADCHRDCLSCGLLLPEQQAFNTLVCLLECEAQVSPALTWDLCHATVGISGPAPEGSEGSVAKRDDGYGDPEGLDESEEVAFNADDGDEDEEQQQPLPQQPQHQQQQRETVESAASDWFRAALRAQQVALEDEERSLDENDEDEAEEEEQQQQQSRGASNLQQSASLRLAKRFGGFMKGRHSYRKLVGRSLPSEAVALTGPSVGVAGDGERSRSLQKRYGGFIGIRKSARKWNSQKRVSQLLRQYLTLTGRPARFNNLSGPGLRRPIDL